MLVEISTITMRTVRATVQRMQGKKALTQYGMPWDLQDLTVCQLLQFVVSSKAFLMRNHSHSCGAFPAMLEEFVPEVSTQCRHP